LTFFKVKFIYNVSSVTTDNILQFSVFGFTGSSVLG